MSLTKFWSVIKRIMGKGKKPVPFFLLLGLIFAILLVFLKESAVREKTIDCGDGGSPMSVNMVGDLLIGSGRVWRQIAADNFNTSILGDYAEPLRKGNVFFANYEGIVSDKGSARSKNLPPQFSVRTNPRIVNFLSHFGNIVLSFANNHSADFGYEAIKDAVNIFSSSTIGYVGMGRSSDNALSPYISDTSGIRVAFLAFTDLLPSEYYASAKHSGIAELTAENLKKSIEIAKKNSDFVIVSLHTANAVSEPFSFWPDEHQKIFSRLAVDYGADLVVGQHPHGLQWVERYGGRLIFYSLGAFLYDPDVSQRYAGSNLLHRSVQFKGGGILNLKVCRDGLKAFSLIPSQMADNNGRLELTSAPMPIILSIKLAIFNWFGIF